MISIGGWRWPLVAALCLVAGGLLAGSGVCRLRYEGRTVLAFSRRADEVARELKIFQSEDVRKKVALAVARPLAIVTYDRVSGQPLQIAISGQAAWPGDVVQLLAAASQICVEQSLASRVKKMSKELGGLRQQKMEAETGFNLIVQERNAALSSAPKRPQAPRADTTAQIRKLQTRRKLLIERYPSHTDIALLAKQIQALESQTAGRSRRTSQSPSRVLELDRQLNGAKLRLDYFSRRIQEVSQAARALKPAWKVLVPARKPGWPSRVDGWPILAGVLAGVLLLGLVLFNGKTRVRQGAARDGLWRPETPQAPPEAPPEAPVELIVVPAEPAAVAVVEHEERLPSDPLTEKAAALYHKWIEVAKVLYSPAPQPPQGVLDQVWPLLQESSEFLPQGHDVLARYLARTVAPGDLPAHVARTILMTLTAAQQAAVSPEHSLAMALAALFHDLAVVARPPEAQDAVGSEVGRLSASVLRRIPGLAPALLSMVEDILIGMDEFKLDTWQNTAQGSNLEPLSKVLREIDRFEKVMQKQKSRIDRQLAHRQAI